ncbi:chromosome partitioning protein [Dietzia sp. 2505]|uniref:chromosome partitioning protein n=1 Tax=Dietzia sp. 2505 TaxID=3156457 RepID=UPI00339B5054
MTQNSRAAHDTVPDSLSDRAVAVDVTDPDLDADVRAVLAALSLDPVSPDSATADVVVTDREGTGGGPGVARLVRVGADGGGGDDEVVRLPSGTADLVGALTAPVAAGRGSLVAVVGAVGGCGASTLAAAIAIRAADSGQALLVEADPRGTGIDLVLGTESEPGLRVEDVRAELGGPDPDALWGAVPEAGPGCRVLARARGGDQAPAGRSASGGAVGAALAHRSAGGLVVCDAGGFTAGDPVLARADLVVVVTRADLQGAVAAGRIVGDLRGAALVIRTHRGDPLDAADVADSAGLARWHVLPEVRSVRRLTGTGDLVRALGRGPRGRRGRDGGGGPGGRVRRLSAVADALLEEVSPGDR